MNNCGDGVMVAYPLFQEEGDGSIPISPLQLEIGPLSIDKALQLNGLWHSRLPKLSNWMACEAWAAQYKNRFYAVAIWGPPIARMFNGKNYWELRRMAIRNEAPKNTASRMLSIMKRLIKKKRPEIIKLISYQDTEVHKGTIYKAAGWSANGFRKGADWSYEGGRYQNKTQARGDKIRWELNI